MGTALYDGKPFRLDPSSVQSSFRIKTRTTDTIGGKVVQVYGVEWGDLVISGSFGRGEFRAGESPPRDPDRDQREFLTRMINIGERQAAMLGKEPPQSFLWPERGWNFQVFLKGYSGDEGGWSVAHDPAIFAPKWTLTFFVVTDNGNMSRRVADQFIERLTKGLGWKQTEYNGPLDDVLAPGFFATPGRNPPKTGPGVITFGQVGTPGTVTNGIPNLDITTTGGI